jgi:hypothetical protein
VLDCVYVKAEPRFGWNKNSEFVAAGIRSSLVRPTEARRDPVNMNVNGQDLSAERVHHHALGDFYRHSR